LKLSDAACVKFRAPHRILLICLHSMFIYTGFSHSVNSGFSTAEAEVEVCISRLVGTDIFCVPGRPMAVLVEVVQNIWQEDEAGCKGSPCWSVILVLSPSSL